MTWEVFARILMLLALVAAAGAHGREMTPLSEGEMAEVSGAGIAVALDDFAFTMAPTSYFEQVGNTPSPNCSGSGSVASNVNCWRRGDLRWYGVNISAASGTGSHWNEQSCSAGSLSCPRGGPINEFSPFDNPYLMRAWSPLGMSYSGAIINADPNNPTKTIYEFLAPTNQPDYTFSFWGEIEAGATRDSETQSLTVGQGTTAGGGLLKSQTIIRGNAAGSIFRMFRFTQTGNETFGMFYHSRLQGDFRFSVAQSPVSGSTDAIGVAPRFDNGEGLHFFNVNAFLPFGQLYYQALVLDAVGTSGNFSLSLTPIPNNPSVLTQFYALDPGDTRGYETARTATRDWATPCAPTDTACLNYRLSHGYVRYGDYYPGNASWSAGGTRNAPNTNNDGIVFQACDDCGVFYAYAYRPLVIDKRGPTNSTQRTQNYNCAADNSGGCSVPASGGPVVSASPGNYNRTYPTRTVNLGDARIEGLMVNHMSLVSCQAGTSC